MAKITIEKDGMAITLEGELEEITEAASEIAESLSAAPGYVQIPDWPAVPWAHPSGTGDTSITWEPS